MSQAGDLHPDLAGVGAEMRAEWRAETEAATDDAVAQWRHSRTLSDWLDARMHAGDRITVMIGDRRFTGLVEETGADLIALRAFSGRVDIHLAGGLPLAIEMHEHATSGGARARTRRNFRDAIIARDGCEVTVGTLHEREGIDGTMYVAADFVSVVTSLGVETVIPAKYVSWVSPRQT
jgi:hypothetical protein